MSQTEVSRGREVTRGVERQDAGVREQDTEVSV